RGDFADRQTILLAALKQALQSCQVRFLCGNDDLAANFMWNTVLAAKLYHRTRSGPGKHGFVAAWLIIDAGMDNAAVTATLVHRRMPFLFKQENLRPRTTPTQRHGCCQSDNPATDDRTIIRH